MSSVVPGVGPPLLLTRISMPPQFLDCGLGDDIHEVFVVEVGPDPVRPAVAFGIDSLAAAFEPFAAAAAKQHIDALAGQGHGDAMSQPLGRCKHKCAFPADTKIHFDHPSCYPDFPVESYRVPLVDFESIWRVNSANLDEILTLT
jgi:hypothetical protein